VSEHVAFVMFLKVTTWPTEPVATPAEPTLTTRSVEWQRGGPDWPAAVVVVEGAIVVGGLVEVVVVGGTVVEDEVAARWRWGLLEEPQAPRTAAATHSPKKPREIFLIT